MKKNFLLLVAFLIATSTISFAQTTSTPEVPKNYKPKPKELLPMPGELTDEMIFPALGKYEYTNKKGDVSNVTVIRDAENKGVIWVNGMPQGKFKADLKASPSTYKIPTQKTLINENTEAGDNSSEVAAETKPAKRYSGKSVQEGTLYFDSTSNKLYINVGYKFNEEDPTAVFPEIVAQQDSILLAQEQDVATEDTATTKIVKKPGKKKMIVAKGTNFILPKVTDMAATDVSSPQ